MCSNSQSPFTHITSATPEPLCGSGIVTPGKKLRLREAEGPARFSWPGLLAPPPWLLVVESLPGTCGVEHGRAQEGSPSLPQPPLGSCRRAVTTGSAAGVQPRCLEDKVHGCSEMKYLRACQVLFRSTRPNPLEQVIPSTAADRPRGTTYNPELGFLGWGGGV